MNGLFEHLPYSAIFITLIAASFGLPVPEDALLLTGGYLCYEGLAQIPFMLATGLVGVLAGDFILFMMGHHWGRQIVKHRVVRRMITKSRLRYAEQLFQKHGIKILFVGRFLPGLRPVIYATAGVLRVRLTTFLFVNGLAACVSVPLFVFLGFYFGDKINLIKRDVQTATHLILFTVLVIVLVVLAIYFHRRQKQILASADESSSEEDECRNDEDAMPHSHQQSSDVSSRLTASEDEKANAATRKSSASHAPSS